MNTKNNAFVRQSPYGRSIAIHRESPTIIHNICSEGDTTSHGNAVVSGKVCVRTVAEGCGGMNGGGKAVVVW